MEIRPFALKLTRDINHYTLKGKIRVKDKSGKLKLPVQANDLPKILSSKILPKAKELQVGQELVLSKSLLVPGFLTVWKRLIEQKLKQSGGTPPMANNLIQHRAGTQQMPE